MNESDAFSGGGRGNHCIGSVVGNGSIDVADRWGRYLIAFHSVQAPQVLYGMRPGSGADSFSAKTDYHGG